MDSRLTFCQRIVRQRLVHLTMDLSVSIIDNYELDRILKNSRKHELITCQWSIVHCFLCKQELNYPKQTV